MKVSAAVLLASHQRKELERLCRNPGSKPRKTQGQVLPFVPTPAILRPMSCPLRIEFPGAFYHVTSCGDRHEPIFEDDSDPAALLGVLEKGMQRFDVQVLAYYQMGNHDHFVLHTRRANLSMLMRHLNGVYT